MLLENRMKIVTSKRKFRLRKESTKKVRRGTRERKKSKTNTVEIKLDLSSTVPYVK